MVIYGYGEFRRGGELINAVHSCDVYELDSNGMIFQIHAYCNSRLLCLERLLITMNRIIVKDLYRQNLEKRAKVIKSRESDLRPGEKMLEQGRDVMSDAELLAKMIGSGLRAGAAHNRQLTCSL